MNRRRAVPSLVPRIAALLALAAIAGRAQGPGTLDPTFWNGGVFELGWGESLQGMAGHSHGYVLAQSRSSLFQIGASSVFQSSDQLLGPFGGSLLATSADGVVAADLVLTRTGAECVRVARYTSAFDPDPTFGGTGSVYGHCLPVFAPFLRVTSVALGTGGTVYVVGAEPTPTPTSTKVRPFLVVVSADGASQSYVAPVLVGALSPVPDAALTSVVVHHDAAGVETLWVGGYYDATPFGAPAGTRDWMVGRIDASGALAPDFPALRTFRWSGGGPLGPWMRLAPTPAGGVYFGGGASTGRGPRLRVTELAADGATVSTFGSLGVATLDFSPARPAYLIDLVAKPGRDGGLYLYGLSVEADGTQPMAVLALDGRGVPVTHFGVDADGVAWLGPPPAGFDLLPVVVPGTLVLDKGALYLGESFFESGPPYLAYSRVSKMLR
jgi:hypothetical protein